MIGQTLGDYKIVDTLGKGGMGIVYKAYDCKLERHVAIKVLNQKVLDKPHFIERFKTEAKHQAQMTHPNIVTVFGFLEAGNVLGIIMEFVEGETLEKAIWRQRKLHLYDALFVLKQVLSGLGYAHSKGILHRDIKPSNIIFANDGSVKIMDFGISKSMFDNGQTQTGVKIGTTMYMSPEQIRGKDVDVRSDVYSLGATFYEMLTGEPPFNYENDYDVMKGHIEQIPVQPSQKNPRVPQIVDEFTLKSLNKLPADRYQNCNEFYSVCDQIDIHLAKIQNNYLIGRKIRRKPGKAKSIFGFATFTFLLLVLSYFSFVQVDQLLQSDQLDRFREYSIYSLFGEDLDFAQMHKVQIDSYNGEIKKIQFVDEKNGYAIGEAGVILTTADGGVKWATSEIDSSTEFNDGYFDKSGKAFLVGNNSAFYLRENYNSEWARLDFRGNYNLLKIFFSNDKNGFIIGSKGLILRSIDGGANWQLANSESDDLLYDMDFLDEETGFIVGWNGTVLKTFDGGLNWKKVKSFTGKYLKSVDFLNEDTGIAVGGGGQVYRTNDAGDTWNLIKVNVKSALNSVQFFNGYMCIIVGNKGEILLSDDWGKSFERVKSKTFVNLNNTFVSREGDIFIAGINGTLLKF